MNRRGFLTTALSPALAAAQTGQRPNVLWIMADQLRFDCLAARSANFSKAFVQSPVWVPSRVSYFTGRYPHSHKNRVNYTLSAGANNYFLITADEPDQIAPHWLVR